MAGVGTVALSGQLNGPTVKQVAGANTYEFKLTDPNTGANITIDWREIWWIDEYPHAPGDTAQGQVAANLGQRTIWVLGTSAQVGAYLNGPIAAGNPAGWNGPEMNYGVGPMGTTIPPCLCPW